MPSGFAALDTGFPNLKAMDSTDQQIRAVEDYLYQLLELLRYQLHNISPENFNTTEVVGWLGETIEEPIKIALANLEGNLVARIEIDEGNLSSLYAKTGVGDLGETETLYSRIDQTADGIKTTVSQSLVQYDTGSVTVDRYGFGAPTGTAASGTIYLDQSSGKYYTSNGSTWAQTGTFPLLTSNGSLISNINQGAGKIETSVVKVDNNTTLQSYIQQVPDAILAQVTDGNGNYTVLNLKSDGLHVGNTAGTTTINGSSIKVRSDANTTLDALTAKENNVTVIDGGKIKTGSVDTNQLAAEAVTAEKIAANTITANEISTDYVYAGEIAASQITSGQIAATYIDSTYLHVNAANIDGTITADSVSANNVTAGKLNASVVELKGEFDVYRGNTLVGSMGGAQGYDGVSTTNGVILRSTNGKYLLVTDSGAMMTAGAHDIYVASSLAHMGGSSNNIQVYNASGAYYNSSEIATQADLASDRRIKTDIDYKMERFEDFFRALQPCSYRRTDIDDHSMRIGFIAQDVQAALENSKLDPNDMGIVFEMKKPPDDPRKDIYYGLNYNDFIGVATHMIQKLLDKVDALEKRIAELEVGNATKNEER